MAHMGMFAPNSMTRIESGAPLAMHEVIGNAATGQHYRADLRAYSWQETVVSAGWSESPQVIAFLGQRPLKPKGSYRNQGALKFEPTDLGEILLIPPSQKLVSICPAWNQRVVSFIFDSSLLPEFAMIEWTPELLRQTLDIRSASIRSIMSGVTQEILQPGFAGDILLEGASLMMLAELYRMFGLTHERKSGGCAQLNQIQLDIITDRVRTVGPAPTLQELADLCGTSRRNFTRLFKRATGITVGQFVADMRIDQAKALLGDKKLLIKEIAYNCGFQNAPAFAAAFRRATSYSPREYRNIVVTKACGQ